MASGFWGGRFERTFFDVRVFNPQARSNRQQSLPATFRRHEREKQHRYEQRVHEVEHASFTPLVMSLSGGFGRAASVTYNRLAYLLSLKYNRLYSRTVNWLRVHLRFSLLHSAVQCIRGHRSSTANHTISQVPPTDLVSAEVNSNI